MPIAATAEHPPDADECPHGIDPSWCSTCIKGPKTHKVAASMKFTKAAVYEKASCENCGRPVAKGQMVRKWTDGSWRHDVCPPVASV